MLYLALITHVYGSAEELVMEEAVELGEGGCSSYASWGGGNGGSELTCQPVGRPRRFTHWSQKRVDLSVTGESTKQAQVAKEAGKLRLPKQALC